MSGLLAAFLTGAPLQHQQVLGQAVLAALLAPAVLGCSWQAPG